MRIWRTAWRSVWRNKRRSAATIAAMTLALVVLVLYSGLVEGYLRGMERNIVDVQIGDVQLHAEGFLESPSKYTLIEDPATVLAALDEAGFPASARVMAGGLAGTEQTSAGVSLIGLDVERDARTGRLDEAVGRGEWLDPTDPQGVVLGRGLARTLGVSPGDELVLISQAMDGAAADGLYHVRGVLQAVADGTDRSAVFMTDGAFRELFYLETGAHEIIVRRPEGADVATVAAQIRRMAPDLDVRSWRELMPTVAQMLDSTRQLVYFIFAIVYLAVAIVILNAMLMAVFERIREFGVLKAIGSGPGRVLGLILGESVIQIGIATLLGLGISAPLMGYLTSQGINLGGLAGMSVAGVAMEPIWYGVYSTSTVAGPVVMLIVMALLAALYPAFKAALIKPVEAMRYQ